MNGDGVFEKISAGALSGAMPGCIAVIANIGGGKEIMDALQQTFPTRKSKVYVVDTSAEMLPEILNRCNGIGLPVIVNCCCNIGAALDVMPRQTPYTAAVISPGSCNLATEYILGNKYVSNAAFIGFQGYYFSPDKLEALRGRYFEELRLGALRENIALVEPLLRNAEYTFIDMKSVRYSDYPHPENTNPNGLYAEEICRIARYAGFGLKCKGIFLHSLPKEGDSMVCSRLAAEVIWHLCEGIAANIPENPCNLEEDEHYVRKIVGMGDNGEEIVFINSYTTDRWWMEIPSSGSKEKYIVPCSASDYKTACCGEIPLRWLFFYQKFAIL